MPSDEKTVISGLKNMKSVLVVLIWTFIVNCDAIQLNATSLLEGKIKNVQYCTDIAGQLKFLARLYSDNTSWGTGSVIAQYLVLTSNQALLGQSRVTSVGILNYRRDVDKYLCEDMEGNVDDSTDWGSPNYNLVVLTLKETAGVDAITLPGTEINPDIVFVRGLQLQLAGFTEDGPALLDLVIEDKDVDRFTNKGVLYIVNNNAGTVRHHMNFNDDGSPILIGNTLIGVITSVQYERTGISKPYEGYYITKFTDHQTFINKVWPYNHPPESSATLPTEGHSG